MLVDCVTLQLPKVHDPRGNLTFVEGGRQIPFDIRRVYYLYDVPGGSERGGHAHLALHQRSKSTRLNSSHVCIS